MAVDGPANSARGDKDAAARLPPNTVWLERLYVLFFIELGSRRVHLAGCTANPSGSWVTQQARQLAWSSTERSTPLRFLVRDRDSKLTRDFDTVFRSEGIEIIVTPVRAPKRTRSPSASSAPSARSASTQAASLVFRRPKGLGQAWVRCESGSGVRFGREPHVRAHRSDVQDCEVLAAGWAAAHRRLGSLDVLGRLEL
jgi:hypothetical protein